MFTEMGAAVEVYSLTKSMRALQEEFGSSKLISFSLHAVRKGLGYSAASGEIRTRGWPSSDWPFA